MFRPKTSALKGVSTLNAVVREDEAVLRFNASGVVRGIVYHLIDEHLASGVSAPTIRQTLDRLVANGLELCIPRARWEEMSNSQRLEWFLSESRTITLVGEGDEVCLRVRR